MNKDLKRRIAFALLMGTVTTGVVSFVLIAVNLGFTSAFARIWLRSWGVGYALAIPGILLLGPRVQALVDRMIP
jgi:hypothetical protein